jgi:hypothetical protein
VSDRATSFLLQGSGWGELTVSADVRFDEGGGTHLERWLELRDQSGRRLTDEAAAGGPRPSVFLSHSLMDACLAGELRPALDARGVDAWSAAEISPAPDREAGLRARMQTADLVVPVVASEVSSVVDQQLRLATKLGREVHPLVLGKGGAPKSLRNLARIEGVGANVDAVGDQLAVRVEDVAVPDEIDGASNAASSDPRTMT